MALTWNRNTLRYEWVPGVNEVAQDPRAAMAGGIVPSLDPTTQYGLAARRMFGEYADRPFMGNYVSGQFEPLYGRYLMGYGGAGEANPLSFTDWLGQPAGGFGSEAGPGWNVGQGAWGQQTGGPTAQTPAATDWADIVNVARTMGLGYGGPRVGTEGGVAQSTYNRWADILKDQEMAQALVSMATYRPEDQLGSIYGGLRQRGLGRMQQEYLTRNPAATTSDWLAYITDPANETAGIVTPDWQVSGQNPFARST